MGSHMDRINNVHAVIEPIFCCPPGNDAPNPLCKVHAHCKVLPPFIGPNNATVLGQEEVVLLWVICSCHCPLFRTVACWCLFCCAVFVWFVSSLSPKAFLSSFFSFLNHSICQMMIWLIVGALNSITCFPQASTISRIPCGLRGFLHTFLLIPSRVLFTVGPKALTVQDNRRLCPLPPQDSQSQVKRLCRHFKGTGSFIVSSSDPAVPLTHAASIVVVRLSLSIWLRT